MSNMNIQQTEQVTEIKAESREGLQALIGLYEREIESENTRWNAVYKNSPPTNAETAAHFQKIRNYRARIASAKIKLEALEEPKDYTPDPEAVQAYEERKADKRERFADMAAKASRESTSTLNRAHTMYEQIPFGQPILVGHHSERGDRNFRNKIHRLHDKGFSLMGKAEHYENKAENYGKGGISSDDPSAIIKLEAQLASLQKNQDLMKAANKAIKAAKTPEAQVAALIALGYDESTAQSVINPRFGRAGFQSYSLTNNNANMSRVKARIEELKKRQVIETIEEDYSGFSYREDTDENRVMFLFEGKPDEDTRTTLKRNGFKWSPNRGAWVRQLTNAGIYAGQQVKKYLLAK